MFGVGIPVHPPLTRAAARGFAGGGCSAAKSKLLRAFCRKLSGEPTHIKRTPEPDVLFSVPYVKQVPLRVKAR